MHRIRDLPSSLAHDRMCLEVQLEIISAERPGPDGETAEKDCLTATQAPRRRLTIEGAILARTGDRNLSICFSTESIKMGRLS
jgi:hypothetical protein